MTDNTTLRGHYERIYGTPPSSDDLAPIPVVSRPVTRHEAAVKFLPRYFGGGSILEIGTGSGVVARTLLELDLGIAKYTLSDIVLQRIESIAEGLRDPRVAVRYFDLDQDFDDSEVGERYDAILMIAVIEHLVDPLRAMIRVRRLLKPGGVAYIDTPNIAKYTRRVKLLLGRFPSTASENEGLTTYEGGPVDLHDEGHLHYFTYRSLALMLTQRCGFSRVDKLSYPSGKLHLGKRLESWLASAWPEAFSELVVVGVA